MSSNRSKVVMGPPFVHDDTGGHPMALPELNAVVSADGLGLSLPAQHPGVWLLLLAYTDPATLQLRSSVPVFGVILAASCVNTLVRYL